MEFDFFKEYLISGKTQKGFAQSKCVSQAWVSAKLRKSASNLFKTQLIDAESFFDNPNHKFDYAKGRKSWLDAIAAYEQAVLIKLGRSNRKIGDLTVPEFVQLMKQVVSDNSLKAINDIEITLKLNDYDTRK